MIIDQKIVQIENLELLKNILRGNKEEIKKF